MPFTRILDLFDPENLPNRQLERTIQPDDPSTVYRDIQDYVLPPEVKEWLFDRPDSLVGQYLGSHSGVPDATCTWITGFFGSGKSHLLKVLAYLLSNKEVTDDAGHTFGATRVHLRPPRRGEPRDPHHRPVLRASPDRPDARLCSRQLTHRPGILDQLHHPELRSSVLWAGHRSPGSPSSSSCSPRTTSTRTFARSWPRRRRVTAIRAVGRDPERRGARPPAPGSGTPQVPPADPQVARIGRGFGSPGRAEERRARGSRPPARERGEGPPSPEGPITRLS